MTSDKSGRICILHAELCTLGDHEWRMETLEEFKLRLGIPKDTQVSQFSITFTCKHCHVEQPPEAQPYRPTILKGG